MRSTWSSSSRSASSCTSCWRRTPPRPETTPLRTGTRRAGQDGALPGEEPVVRQRRGRDHGFGLVERPQRKMRVRADGERRARAGRAHEELTVRDAVALVDLDRDPALHAERDEPLLPLRGVRDLGVAERLQRRERWMAEDVDAVSLDALRDDLQDPLADPRPNGRIREAVTRLGSLVARLPVIARVVVG